jgi:hypothetical protein
LVEIKRFTASDTFGSDRVGVVEGGAGVVSGGFTRGGCACWDCEQLLREISDIRAIGAASAERIAPYIIGCLKKFMFHLMSVLFLK